MIGRIRRAPIWALWLAVAVFAGLIASGVARNRDADDERRVTGTMVITLPSSWELTERREDDGTLRWDDRVRPDTRLVVTRVYDARTSKAAATAARAATRGRAGTVQHSLRRVTLAGRAAWRWDVTQGGTRSAAYYLQTCEGGVMVMRFMAPKGRFMQYRPIFSRAAATVAPRERDGMRLPCAA